MDKDIDFTQVTWIQSSTTGTTLTQHQPVLLKCSWKKVGSSILAAK